MKKIILASKNKGKIKELEEMLEGENIKVTSLLDVEFEDIAETGETFAENAKIKAEAAAQAFHSPAVADDSGLEIDALQGRPGVYSARYAGEEKSDEKNMDKVLQELQNVPVNQRSARFVSTIAVAVPGKETLIVEGIVNGVITDKKQGDKGFGYDPIFYVPELGKTMAELPPEEKNRISHRKRALEKLQKRWKDIL
ncbi:XTP/dITP diphosphatase [Bacillus sp. FJAT-44742]|uniref:XTP/dITP diphosphatase n=1 Tax=Bacillus sp. FJAT-44742 TaxID=2014005 RepID=UPI000C24FB33|nr:XTP/dITP diphosphatase [Bacillus sp. FJAT-44742]